MTLTLDTMRADIAELIDLDPSEIGDDDHLPDLGLDSMRLMQLVAKWDAAGAGLDFAIFAESATLGEWWAAVAAQAARG